MSFTPRRKREIIFSQSCDHSLSLRCTGLSYMLFCNRIALHVYYLLYTDLCLRLGGPFTPIYVFCYTVNRGDFC